MSPRPWIVALALASAACTGPRSFAPGMEIQTSFLGGYRLVDQDEFDGHPAYGFELATNGPATGWGYELSGTYGIEDRTDGVVEHEGRFKEVGLGMRKTWGGSQGLRTVVGFGGATTRLEHHVDPPSRHFTDYGAAAYAHAALQWVRGEVPFDPGTNYLIGVDLRVLGGDDFSYAQLAVVLGFVR